MKQQHKDMEKRIASLRQEAVKLESENSSLKRLTKPNENGEQSAQEYCGKDSCRFSCLTQPLRAPCRNCWLKQRLVLTPNYINPKYVVDSICSFASILTPSNLGGTFASSSTDTS